MCVCTWVCVQVPVGARGVQTPGSGITDGWDLLEMVLGPPEVLLTTQPAISVERIFLFSFPFECRISLNSVGYPGIQNVDHTGLSFTEILLPLTTWTKGSLLWANTTPG